MDAKSTTLSSYYVIINTLWRQGIKYTSKIFKRLFKWEKTKYNTVESLRENFVEVFYSLCFISMTTFFNHYFKISDILIVSFSTCSSEVSDVIFKFWIVLLPGDRYLCSETQGNYAFLISEHDLWLFKKQTLNETRISKRFRNSILLCSSQTIPKASEENDQWQPKTS